MTLSYERQKIRQGYKYIIGCDEVGRGSLAGPVVAAAVAFAPASLKLSARGGSAFGGKVKSYKEIKDSKLLSPQKRQELSKIIKQHALWAVGVVDQEVIDGINIHNASLLAMRRAVESLLGCHCQEAVRQMRMPTKQSHSENILLRSDAFARNDSCFLYIDGKFTIPSLNIKQEAVVEGDNKILSIAAASIIAKVYRDNLMQNLHRKFPIYNFSRHKGYATEHHRQMIIKNGLSPVHRQSFCENLI